jgi:hypothetical protein
MLIKKTRKFLFFISKNRYGPRGNQIDFLFSGYFHIGLVIIKKVGYRKKKKRFFSIFYQESKKDSYQTRNKIGNKDKVSRPDSLNYASIRYSDI